MIIIECLFVFFLDIVFKCVGFIFFGCFKVLVDFEWILM